MSLIIPPLLRCSPSPLYIQPEEAESNESFTCIGHSPLSSGRSTPTQARISADFSNNSSTSTITLTSCKNLPPPPFTFTRSRSESAIRKGLDSEEGRARLAYLWHKHHNSQFEDDEEDVTNDDDYVFGGTKSRRSDESKNFHLTKEEVSCYITIPTLLTN